MPQTKTEIRALLDAADARPKHRFGQNFMIDQNLVAAVADAGEVAAGDFVIEVGPGTGTLTEELLARVGETGRVVAVEIDRDLAGLLRRRFGGEGSTEVDAPVPPDPRRLAAPLAGRVGERDAAGRAPQAGRLNDGESVAARVERFHLIEGDALAGKHELNPDLLEQIRLAAASGRPAKLVANLPYNIASPLAVELLAAGVDLLAFTVQKEVADRLRARPGTGEYGPLTVMVQLLSSVEVLRTLPPQAFWPAPKIDSALVRLRRADRLGTEVRPFGDWLRAVFSMRRKTLRKAILETGGHEGALDSLGIDPQARPETLDPPALLALYRALQTLHG